MTKLYPAYMALQYPVLWPHLYKLFIPGLSSLPVSYGNLHAIFSAVYQGFVCCKQHFSLCQAGKKIQYEAQAKFRNKTQSNLSSLFATQRL